MNEKEQAKANLNRQLAREGGLQRAGMRKCVIVRQHSEDLEASGFYVETKLGSKFEKALMLSKISVGDEDSFLESIEEFYFHHCGEGFVLLETEGGLLFEAKSRVRFIT